MLTKITIIPPASITSLQKRGIGKSFPRKKVIAPITPKTIPATSPTFSNLFKRRLFRRAKIPDNNISATPIRRYILDSTNKVWNFSSPVSYRYLKTPFKLPELIHSQALYISSDITSDMLSDWLSRVGSAIPRGFSRYYILGLLKEQPMTGKEIIDKAILQSDGKWRPSPGLIYPLLGRLLEEGLITETDNGKYQIAKKGLDIAADIDSVHNIIQKQLDVMLRVGNIGRFMAMDLIDRVSTIGSTLSSNLDRMTEEERNKYRQFLQTELNKLDEQKNSSEKVSVE